MTSADSPGIDALRALWAQAENQMYPLAAVSPEKYEQLIRLAREAANDLAAAVTPVQLAQRWAEGAAIVEAASTRAQLPLGDLPVGEVAGVAFALRDAELRAIETQRKLEHAIAEAQTAGNDWVVIHEKGNLERGLLDAYQAIEMHLPTGAAIVASVEPNPGDGRANHVLTVIRLDPSTGATVDLNPGIAETQEHPEPSEFLSSRLALRELVEGQEV